MKIIQDIRQQIPQFSANFFPPYVYQPYPRMMVDNTNPAKPKPYLDASKKPIAVHSEQEEAAFWAAIKPAVEAPKAIDALVAAEPRQKRK